MRQATDKIGTHHNGNGWIQFSILGWVMLFAIVTASAQQKNSLIKTVVIDAGHGGKDPGSVVGRAKEKNIVLDIALKVGKHIRDSQKKIKVVYIRDGDYFVPLMDRAQIANKVKADLFISIHANYCSNPAIFGTETYVLGLHRTEDNLNVAKKENSVILLEEDYSSRYEGFNPNLSESYIMFELIQDNYLDQSLRFASTLQTNFKNLAQRRDREVRQAGFLVLRETSMPSVLVEVGYLSNKSENSFLMTDAGRSEIARAIFGSTIDYLNLDDSNNNQEVGNDQRKLSVPQVQEITPVKNPSSRIGTVETVIKGRINEEVNGSVKQQGNSAGKQTEIEPKITYAIQIGVFTHRVGLNSKYFKGITPIKEISYDGKFKYFCSESKTFQTTKSDYIKIARLFPDAFVVSIQNNQTKMVWKNGGPK